MPVPGIAQPPLAYAMPVPQLQSSIRYASTGHRQNAPVHRTRPPLSSGSSEPLWVATAVT
eukprot:123593-Rhodomonas_salina.1